MKLHFLFKLKGVDTPLFRKTYYDKIIQKFGESLEWVEPMKKGVKW